MLENKSRKEDKGPVQVVQLSTFHFSMSQNRIQIESVKKIESQNYPNSIREILAMFPNFSMFFESIAKSKKIHKNIFILVFFYYVKPDSSRCLDFFTKFN